MSIDSVVVKVVIRSTFFGIAQSACEMDRAVHQRHRLTRPRSSGDAHGSACLPLHNLALIGVEEDPPLLKRAL